MAAKRITKEMIIADVLAAYPQTEKVFKKHFGKGCYTCPGSKVEDVEFGSTMHNVELEIVLAELNKAAKLQ